MCLCVRVRARARWYITVTTRNPRRAKRQGAAELLFRERLQRYEIKLAPDVRSKYT